jgi:hypothetical protein
VVRDVDARHLTDPAQTWGVPLLAATEEMGFFAQVAVVATSAGRAAEAADAVRRARTDPATIDVAVIDGRPALSDWLAGLRARAVYSERFGDRRLAEAGLAAFDGRHFERGLRGATATAARLLEVCELPFYSRYGAHLARAAARTCRPPALGFGGSTGGGGAP